MGRKKTKHNRAINRFDKDSASSPSTYSSPGYNNIPDFPTPDEFYLDTYSNSPAVTHQGENQMRKHKTPVIEVTDEFPAEDFFNEEPEAGASSNAKTTASPASTSVQLSTADALKKAWKDLSAGYFNEKVARIPTDHSIAGRLTWKAMSFAGTIDGWDTDYQKNMEIVNSIAIKLSEITADSADSRSNLGKALDKAESKLGIGSNTFYLKLNQMIQAFKAANTSTDANADFAELKEYTKFTDTPSGASDRLSKKYIEKHGYKSSMEKEIDGDIKAIEDTGKRMDAEMANALRYLYILNQQEELDTHHLLFGLHLMSRTLVSLRGLVGEPDTRDAFVTDVKDNIQAILEGYKTDKAQYLRAVPSQFTQATKKLTEYVKDKNSVPFKRNLANMFLKEADAFANKSSVKQKLGATCDLTCSALVIPNKPAEKKMAAKA